jgi:hypothetical protein
MKVKSGIKIMSKIKIYFVVILASALFSCEDVIVVELDSEEPQIVIEGSVTDGLTSTTVYISKSGDFYEPSIFENVSGAAVTISDSRGNSEDLVEIDDGVYETRFIIGRPGDTYNISVNSEGENYRAESTMPAEKILLDSIVIKQSTIGRKQDERYDLWLYFQDIPDVKNYCRFRIYHNNILRGGFPIYDDRLSDGNYIEGRVRYDEEKDGIKIGDTFKIELINIDRANYDYFNTANDVSASGGGGNGPGAVAPTNPTTNWNNNALGYFGAYAVSTATTVLVE